MNVTLPFRQEGHKHVGVRKISSRAFCHFLAEKEEMSYRIAAIDIHKSVLMVVVATGANQVEDPIGEGLEFECRRFGTGHQERLCLWSWLQERGVVEVVMESTAQYGKPV